MHLNEANNFKYQRNSIIKIFILHCALQLFKNIMYNNNDRELEPIFSEPRATPEGLE